LDDLRAPVRTSFDSFRGGRGPDARLRFDDLRVPRRALPGALGAGGPYTSPDAGDGDFAHNASGFLRVCLRGRRAFADLASTGSDFSSMAIEISRHG
jgi:hypothetical protein